MSALSYLSALARAYGQMTLFIIAQAVCLYALMRALRVIMSRPRCDRLVSGADAEEEQDQDRDRDDDGDHYARTCTCSWIKTDDHKEGAL
jgi:hypothetical protein